GRRPTAVMMPNFRNVKKQEMDFLRGYMVFYSATRAGWARYEDKPLGRPLKDAVTEPGGWGIYMMMQGETIPKEENHVRLSQDEKDEWGRPLLIISVGYDDNDEKSMKDYLE